jgi:hypothetical protein
VLFWKPQVALFVNEETLLPMLLLFGPAASVLDRFVSGLETLLDAHGLAAPFIAAELTEVSACRLAKTNNRSVLGMVSLYSGLKLLRTNGLLEGGPPSSRRRHPHAKYRPCRSLSAFFPFEPLHHHHHHLQNVDIQKCPHSLWARRDGAKSRLATAP